MSSESAFNELYAAWHISKGGPANLINNATLTRSDLIKLNSATDLRAVATELRPRGLSSVRSGGDRVRNRGA